ncbi:MAG: hypothetical protein ABI164_01765 [Acidobacteriaceae bacterium]
MRAESTPAAVLENRQKAHSLLTQTIQALGGPAFLQQNNARMQVRIARFFRGKPTGKTLIATITSESPNKSRLDVPRQHFVQLFSGNAAWEITYKGKRALPPQESDSALRMKKHALLIVLGKWFNTPATVLIDEGPSQVERRPTEKIKLVHQSNDAQSNDAQANDAVTLEIDTESHLPLRLSFTWRDPRFSDRTLEVTEFDNYHVVDGIATPFTVTQTQNGEVIREMYVQKVKYNIALPPDFFDPDAIAAHLK